MATISIRLPNGELQPMSYPDDWTDAQLKEAINGQFPQYSGGQSQEPKGMQQQPQQEPRAGFGGIASDISESFQNAPGAIMDAFKSLPHEAYESGKQIGTNFPRAMGNVGAGLLEGAKGAFNLPLNIGGYLGEKGTPLFKQLLPLIQKLKIGDTGLQQKVLGEEQEGDKLLQTLSAFSPYAKLGGLGKGLGGTARRAGAASLYAGGQNEDPIQAALMGLVGEGGVKGIQKAVKSIPGIGKVKPSNMFRGELSPEELESNYRAAVGTNTPLGSVLEEPKLKALFENVTSNVPFSGAKDILGSIKKQVGEQADMVMKSIEPKGAQGDLNDLTQSLLKTAFKEQRNAKNALYKERDAVAKSESHDVDLPTFEKLAHETTKSFEDSPLYQNDPDFRRAYKKLLGYKDTNIDIESPILDKSGKPLVSKTIKPTLTEATMTASTLNEEGQKLLNSASAKDRSLGGLYKKMASALKKDIESGIETRGSDALKKAQTKANENYKKNFSGFLDKNIYKHLSDTKDPQKIVNEIIKPGAKNDQYRDIKKVNKLLPESQKNLLGFTYLKGAENKQGVLSPKKLARLIESLGTRQFEALFPDEFVRKKILDYGKLRGMNEEALSVLHNPKTGARNTQALIGSIQAVIGGTTGNPFLGVLPSILSKSANKWLTSESVRDKIIKKMIESSKKQKEKKPSRNIAPFVNALTQSNTGTKKRKPLELELTKSTYQRD